MCDCISLSRRQVLGGAASLGVVALAGKSQAQQRLRMQGPICAMNGVETIGDLTVFEASPSATRVVSEICDVVGLPANFRIYSVQDESVNAYAKVIGADRLIVYGVDFMDSIADQQSRNWSGLTVMAHEIGHHLCGHTLDGVGSRPPKELEADHFGGFVVARLGGPLEGATQVFASLPEVGTATHPARDQRVAAVTAGWNKVMGLRGGRKEERHNVITHEGRDGKWYPMIVEFVGRGQTWTEYQHGRAYAKFQELHRQGSSVYIRDATREIWVKLDITGGGGFAFGYWSYGDAGVVPDRWTALDPRDWR